MRIVTRKEIVEQPRPELRPHVVLLGAGASRAAFPEGDAQYRRVPLMQDLVETLNLWPAIRRSGVLPSENFEAIYSRLAADPQHSATKKKIEQEVESYFSCLSLPEEATVYDRILLSLRPEDAVFTFNWDPFLFDAYARNSSSVGLPNIFFLHGSVRIGGCRQHTDQWGRRHTACPVCSEPFEKVPLLYPVEHKDYSKDPYVSGSWEAAEQFFKDALVVTVFGYSAPEADAAAMKLLKSAWFADGPRKTEHIEIIDIVSEAELYARWSRFTPTNHLHTRRSLHDSWIEKWPRRTREGLLAAMYEGSPAELFPLSHTEDRTKLLAQVREIAKWETGVTETS